MDNEQALGNELHELASNKQSKKEAIKMSKQPNKLPTFREVPTPDGNTVKISFSKITAGNLTKTPQFSGEGQDLLKQASFVFFHALKEHQPNIKQRDAEFIYEAIEDKDRLDAEVMRLFADAIEDSRKGGTIKLGWD